MNRRKRAGHTKGYEQTEPETFFDELYSLRHSRLVPGGGVYRPRFFGARKLENDGADFPDYVPDLWAGGSVVSHGPSGRLVGRRAGGKSRSPDYGIKTCGAIHSSRTPLYGIDFSDGIPVGPMAHGSWSLPVGLFHLAGQYRRSNPSGFRAFMVRNRIVV